MRTSRRLPIRRIPESSDKIKKIQNNVAKQNVRFLLVQQIIEWIAVNPTEKITAITLPADEWFFESMLNLALSTKSIRYYAAETDLSTYLRSLYRKPNNATMYFGDILHILDNKIVSDGHTSRYSLKVYDKIYANIVWADFCCYPTTALIKQFAEATKTLSNKALVYFTFNLGLRGSWKRIADDFNTTGLQSKKNIDNLIEATENYCLEQLQHQHKKKNIQLVFKARYHGGNGVKSPMITIGFNIGAKPIVYKNYDLRTQFVATTKASINQNNRFSHHNIRKFQDNIALSLLLEGATDVIIAKETGLHKTRLKLLKRSSRRDYNMSQKVNKTDKATKQTLAMRRQNAAKDNKDYIIRAIKKGKTSQEIADKVGCSIQSVAAIRAHITMGNL